MATIRMTMAQALIAFLDQQYVSVDGKEHKFVQGVMGIFGHGNVTGIGEALEQQPGSLTFIQGKNEQGMVHAATAYAKQRNRLSIYACTSSIGPGALNMVTAAATATVNRIPVLLLPGDIFADRQPDPVLQQLEVPADYSITVNDAFKPVSRYWDRITRPEQLITACQHAMRVLLDPADTGAVTLCLPQDVQCEAYDYPEWFFAKQVYELDRRPPAMNGLERAIELIASKRKPLIIAGGGVHYAQATNELIAVAEKFHIPVVETQAGKSAIPWNHRLAMGSIGVTGSLAGNLLARDADLVIAVGTRLADFTTASKTAFAHPDVQFLSINISSLDAMKMNGMPLVADAQLALQAILSAEALQSYQSDYNDNELYTFKQQWEQEVDRLYKLEVADGLAQTAVIGTIRHALAKEDIIVCAAGSLPGDLHRIWRSELPKTYHMEYGFSCMGYEVAGTFGVKLAEPDKEVYAIIGDGSFLMLHSELLTSLQEQQKINIILLDNSGYQCIHNLQRGHGSEGFGNEFRYRGNKGLNGELMKVDYAGIASAMGAVTYQPSTLEELAAAIQASKAEKCSTLIEVKVLPGTNTDNYASWWRVDTAAVSTSAKVNSSYQDDWQKRSGSHAD